jgi:hypothetical protein
VGIVDTDNATAADRVKLYINGVRVIGFSSSTDPSSGALTWVNSTNGHRIGSVTATGNIYFDGYLSEVNFIDGQALTHSSFGETNSAGVWVPKKYTGTYGTNGFYLDFSAGSSPTTLGYDHSGNSNNWLATDISTTDGATYDWMEDTPTNNYAVLSAVTPVAGTVSITKGNLSYTNTHASSIYRAYGNVQVSSGKWYWEVTVTTGTNGDIGIRLNDQLNSTSTNGWVGELVNGYSLRLDNGQKYSNNVFATYGGAVSAGDVISIAYDADTGTIYFAKAGQWASGGGAFNQSWGSAVAAYTGLSGTVVPCFGTWGSNVRDCNFGQRPFLYTPPTDFKALCTANLPSVTIANPAQHFDVLTHTATGSGTIDVTGAQFTPDFVWAKSRNDSNYHVLVDVVRGVNKPLSSNLTNAETSNDCVAAFLSNGFTASGTDNDNISLNCSIGGVRNYVDWLWRAGTAPTTDNVAAAGAVPTAGSVKIDGMNMTSTLAGTIAAKRISANTTAGFSVVTYTGSGVNGATVEHGLGVAPRFIIIKGKAAGLSWKVYHASVTANGGLYLDLHNAYAASTVFWNNTAPTSSVFSLGIATQLNRSADTYVAYCFAEIPGYSKISSYTGNGSADGPFVYCGFRPRYLMIKMSSSTGHWLMKDAARNPTNEVNNNIVASSANAENEATVVGTTAVNEIDFTANGFKIRDTHPYTNTNGGTYIFLAFAEHPFGGENCNPSPAR